MLMVYPDYYTDFKCAAGACRHSCCVGWEIDIDPDTLELYRSVTGELGSKLKNCISAGDEAHFILDGRERCPFLTGDGLCELILAGGEDMLCQICYDHPRFRNYICDRCETGLGLCCEAAAELILGRKKPMELILRGEGKEPPARIAGAIELRDRALALAADPALSLRDRCEKILSLCQSPRPCTDLSRWCEIFMGLERLDTAWTDRLTALRGGAYGPDKAALEAVALEHASALGQLLSYFIYRHLLGESECGDIPARAAFAVLGTCFIHCLAAAEYSRKGSLSFSELTDIARMYSGEIEYSMENTERLLSLLGGGRPAL
ncbi:MAG: flagellin lysine-N-methylase [Oscillospiraceae bacterium]|nr:flagellin lysine-N-methylase [Oscillospiraceae bacterium]